MFKKYKYEIDDAFKTKFLNYAYRNFKNRSKFSKCMTPYQLNFINDQTTM